MLAAAARGVGQEVAFAVGPIEMEFAVELRPDAQVKAGFKAWVLSGEVQAGVARGTTHRVTMTLTLKRANGADLLISSTPGQQLTGGDVWDM